MNWPTIAQFIATALRASAPLCLVAIGAVFSYRAGIFHLGLEGIMLVGAFASVAGTKSTGSVWVGIALAIVCSVLVSVLFWFVIGPLKADPVIAGLGLSTLALGGTSYALQAIYDSRGAIYVDNGLWRPVKAARSGVLAAVSDLSVMVWLSPVFAVVAWMILKRTRFGLQVVAVGEYPFAARSAGVNPARIRLQTLMITGAMCGLGGAELALGSLRSFTENITQGRGFISFTAVVFGDGQPIGAALGALFFGTSDAVGIQSQLAANGLPVPREVLLALPYVLTIIAVWYGGVRRRKRGTEMLGFGEFRDN